MKLLRRLFVYFAIMGVLTVFIYFFAVPVGEVMFMPDDIRLSQSEIEENISVTPNRLVVGSYDNIEPTDDNPRTYIDLKLFGVIKLKRIMVDILPYESVYAGGVPIGFIAKTDGVVVLQDGQGYKRGDVITKMDSAPITSVIDLKKHLGDTKLGLWVKDETSGVGTLTYVNPDNNNFAALGHRLIDFETGAHVQLRGGEVYSCNVIGIEKSNKRTVGSIESTLKKGSNGVQGSILSSNDRGVFGCLNDGSVLLQYCRDNLYPVSSRYTVKPGKASILVSLDGENIKEYEIEIIKTRYQKKHADKGIIFRITDSELLAATGGIVHGMSGSPIIQKGHIIGAVTHVITGDVTKGYGVYIDFVLP